MKKLVFILFIFNCSFLIAFGQITWITRNIGTNQNLNDIIFFYQYGVICGNNGLIYKSNDSGRTWQPKISGVTTKLNKLTYNGNVFAVGDGGTVLLSTDYGDTWTSVNIGTTANLNSVSGSTMIVGDNGTIFKGNGSGTTWIPIQSPTNVNLCDISGYYIAGANGTMMKSTNQGYNWTVLSSPTTNNLKSVRALTFNVFVVGDNGTFLKNDAYISDSFFVINTGVTTNLRCISGNYSFKLGGNGGNIFYTNNYNQPPIVPEYTQSIYNINSIKINSIFTGFAVGDNGILLEMKGNGNKQLDANNISTWFTNYGSFNRNPTTGNAGFEWPRGSNLHQRYASGIWLGAIVNNDILVSTAEYDYEYLGGYTNNSGIPQGYSHPEYRIYKLTYGLNDEDRQSWPNVLLGNSDQGAPVIFENGQWKPFDFGSQTIFRRYTDSYGQSHGNRAGSTLPLKADIMQTDFSYNTFGGLADVTFNEFKIINRSTNVWNSTYFNIWFDDDIGGVSDNLGGCDSVSSLAFTYTGSNDPVYGSNSPAVGFLILRGPLQYTGNITDTAWICVNKTRIPRIRYKILYMSSSFVFRGSDPVYGDPRNYVETYRVMQGFSPQTGQPIIDPNNHPTKFIYYGDPELNTGWLDPSLGDKRALVSSGPVNVPPGDTQTIVVAQLIARGTSNLNSVTKLKQLAVEVRNFYNICYNSPIGIEPNSNNLPDRFALYQNFPNPFNPSTKIKFDIPTSPPAPLLKERGVKLVIYDVLGREVTVLVNEQKKPGRYEVEWPKVGDASNFPSGVYFYKLISGSFEESRKMILLK